MPSSRFVVFLLFSFLLLKTMSSPKKIVLKSSDGEAFVVNEVVALESQTIKHMIDDGYTTDDGILLPNVTGKILAKIIEYCKMHVDPPTKSRAGILRSYIINAFTSSDDYELKSWDADFVEVDQATLFDLMRAAYYLNIKGLLDLTAQTFADMITVNIHNDITPEEEEEILWENQWAFEL